MSLAIAGVMGLDEGFDHEAPMLRHGADPFEDADGECSELAIIEPLRHGPGRGQSMLYDTIAEARSGSHDPPRGPDRGASRERRPSTWLLRSVSPAVGSLPIPQPA